MFMCGRGDRISCECIIAIIYAVADAPRVQYRQGLETINVIRVRGIEQGMVSGWIRSPEQVTKERMGGVFDILN